MTTTTVSRTVPSQSILSKVNKSKGWKAAKRQRHDENVKYRADLHREKISGSKGANEIQMQIDQISKRGSYKR